MAKRNQFTKVKLSVRVTRLVTGLRSPRRAREAVITSQPQMRQGEDLLRLWRSRRGRKWLVKHDPVITHGACDHRAKFGRRRR
jgi:hypothetical protein